MNTRTEEMPALIPSIRFLRIERFRGIEKLEWCPAPGLNVIVGPGDSCKSTVLEAIGALLSPAPNFYISEFDYFQREIKRGFEIEAAIAVGDATILKSDRFPLPPLRGWKDKRLTDLPDEDGAEAVIVCRLTGSPDQEAVYEVIGADQDTRMHFSRSLRQRIGLMRLDITDRWDRDLRLVQGGALDRYLDGHQLRQSILQAILNTPIHDRLDDDPKEALRCVEKLFSKRGLPHPLRLGLIGTPGVSLAASVGLMIGTTDESALPLPAWGMGTRRLATLELSSILANTGSIAIVDEPESGLEPYRQRAFINQLHQEGGRQAFFTTHSPAILSASAALGAAISRLNSVSHPTTTAGAMKETLAEPAKPAQAVPMPAAPIQAAPVLTTSLPATLVPVARALDLKTLEGKEINELLALKPETVFARLSVVCEGITEEGFATKLLSQKFGKDFSARGVFCVDAGGHDRAIPICKAMQKAGFDIAAVADDEGRKEGSWNEIARKAILLRWENGENVEHAVLTAMPTDVLPQVVNWPEEFGGKAVRHCLADLRAALGVDNDGRSAERLLEEYGQEAFVTALYRSACPRRDGNRKPTGWFKSFDGGFLLAEKLMALKPVPKALADKIALFLDSVERVTAT